MSAPLFPQIELETIYQNLGYDLSNRGCRLKHKHIPPWSFANDAFFFSSHCFEMIVATSVHQHHRLLMFPLWVDRSTTSASLLRQPLTADVKEVV